MYAPAVSCEHGPAMKSLGAAKFQLSGKEHVSIWILDPTYAFRPTAEEAVALRTTLLISCRLGKS